MKSEVLKKRVQSKIDECTSAFEAAFKTMQEAKQIAYYGGTSISEMLLDHAVDIKELDATLNAAGWSSSSIRCW